LASRNIAVIVRPFFWVTMQVSATVKFFLKILLSLLSDHRSCSRPSLIRYRRRVGASTLMWSFLARDTQGTEQQARNLASGLNTGGISEYNLFAVIGTGRWLVADGVAFQGVGRRYRFSYTFHDNNSADRVHS